MKQENNLNENKELSSCLSYYENEELFKFYSLISSSQELKNEIYKIKNKQFLEYEESTINFFLTELNDKETYTKVKGSKINSSFRKYENNIILKFETDIEVNIIDLISIIYEIENYKKWCPYTEISENLSQPGKAKKCAYFVLNIPIITNRDFLVYGFGINRIKENGTVLLLSRSINENTNCFINEFNMKKNSKFIRGDMPIFGLEMKQINHNKIHIRGLADVNPKLNFIPQFIIDFLTVKIAEVFLLKFIDIVKNYKGSEYENKNPSQIDNQFYNFIKRELSLNQNENKEIENNKNNTL